MYPEHFDFIAGLARVVAWGFKLAAVVAVLIVVTLWLTS